VRRFTGDEPSNFTLSGFKALISGRQWGAALSLMPSHAASPAGGGFVDEREDQQPIEV
jgi:hypothetical protein